MLSICICIALHLDGFHVFEVLLFSHSLAPFLLLSLLKDELLWGAAWLHRATKNPTYLNYIQVNGQALGADETDNTFGWDNKHVGARIILSKVSSFPFSFLS